MKNHPQKTDQIERSMKEINDWKEKRMEVQTQLELKINQQNDCLSIGLKCPEGDHQHLNELVAASLYKAIGMTDPSICGEVFRQTTTAMAGEEIFQKADFALNFFKEMKPRDAYESMLISRMIALHSQYMDYLARAANPDTSLENRNMNINRSSKLMRLWNEAKDKLDKHRKKNDQQIEVKHFHVNANQAIVGSNLKMGGGDTKNCGGTS